MSRHTIHVLLVEDNEGDVLLVEAALAGGRLDTALHVVVDGPQALTYLRADRTSLDDTLPQLVLLDLNLPGMSGGDVLAEMKTDPHLRAMPVVVLSGSRSREDVADAYDRHANSYIMKPGSFSGYEQVIRSLEDYWFATALLPESTR